MSYLYKIFAVLLGLLSITRGELREVSTFNKKILPIEVLLNTPRNSKLSSVPVSGLIKDQNKAIKLQIRSDEGGEGKVDLIIAATKEIQTTEQTIDRYSPAFNAEYDLVNDETPRNFKSPFKVNRNWDTSREDSSMFYPSQSAETFPYLTLRHVLQTSQPLMLGQNQFSPLQSLRYFENNLQRQVLPHMIQGMGSFHEMPVGVVASQPIFTGGISPDIHTQQRFQSAPQDLNSLQQGLLRSIQLNNRGISPGVTHQLSALQSPPVNRYPLVNSSPQNKAPPERENSLQNNHQSFSTHRPFQHYSHPQRAHHPPNSNALQSVPEILAPNKQPLPDHERPGYTLERNYRNLNIPSQTNLEHQQPILPQTNNYYSNVPQINHGVSNENQNYQLNQNLRTTAHQQVPVNQQYQHLYQIPQQTDIRHNYPNPNQNDQPILYRSQNIQNADHGRINNHQEPYRSPLKELNAGNLGNLPINQPNLYYTSHQGSSQPALSNNLQNPSYRNEQLQKLQENDRTVPVYHHSSEGSNSQNFRHGLTNNHNRNPVGSGSITQPQSSFSPVQTRLSTPQLYQENSYRTPLRNVVGKDSDLNEQADEIREPTSKRRPKYKEEENYESGAPTKKRKLKRKRVQPKDTSEDLEGHSSHQYIIKIG